MFIITDTLLIADNDGQPCDITHPWFGTGVSVSNFHQPLVLLKPTWNTACFEHFYSNIPVKMLQDF